VAAVHCRADDVPADEAGPADHEDAHVDTVEVAGRRTRD
jgi:hypothetical protein